jgi:adenine-specific DNA methylase
MLESLLDAGFYLAATYPIRSDETKGQGEFGSRTIEYDVILVCRKRANDPGPASWTRMRRELMAEALRLQAMLEEQSGHKLPPADQRVIRRGKALEYYSRHFGQVFLDSGELISLPQILVDVNGPGEPRRSRRQRSRTEDNPD